MVPNLETLNWWENFVQTSNYEECGTRTRDPMIPIFSTLKILSVSKIRIIMADEYSRKKKYILFWSIILCENNVLAEDKLIFCIDPYWQQIYGQGPPCDRQFTISDSKEFCIYLCYRKMNWNVLACTVFYTKLINHQRLKVTLTWINLTMVINNSKIVSIKLY